MENDMNTLIISNQRKVNRNTFLRNSREGNIGKNSNSIIQEFEKYDFEEKLITLELESNKTNSSYKKKELHLFFVTTQQVIL